MQPLVGLQLPTLDKCLPTVGVVTQVRPLSWGHKQTRLYILQFVKWLALRQAVPQGVDFRKRKEKRKEKKPSTVT